MLVGELETRREVIREVGRGLPFLHFFVAVRGEEIRVVGIGFRDDLEVTDGLCALVEILLGDEAVE